MGYLFCLNIRFVIDLISLDVVDRGSGLASNSLINITQASYFTLIIIIAEEHLLLVVRTPILRIQATRYIASNLLVLQLLRECG